MATSKNRKKQAERLSTIRGFQGDRLGDCLELRKKTQAYLIKKYEEEFHVKIPSSHLSMIKKGNRSLPYDYAIAFSKYLDVDSGYLLGSDRFKAESYDEYLEIKEARENISRVEEIRPMLERYLKPNGYSIVGYGPDGDDESNLEEYSFSIKHGNNIYSLSYNELVQFNMHVDVYVKLSAQDFFGESKKPIRTIRRQEEGSGRS